MRDRATSGVEYIIEVAGVERTFAAAERKVKALRGVDLRVPRGAFVVLMGPSGSGKTTLLNLVGGLDQPTGGYVAVNGRRLDEMGGHELAELRRRIGFIFQSFALMPTATAYENVELGLRLSGRTPRREWDVRVRRCLAAVGLTNWMHHRPYEMSGGQQQRVAMARAIVAEPRLLLLDEPFSNLDVALRDQLRFQLRELRKRLDITIILVTHDQADAFTLSDRIAVLRRGRVEQVGTPEEIYDRPATEYVRSFIGRSSRLTGRWAGGNTVALGDGAYLPVASVNGTHFARGDTVALIIRPQDVRLVAGEERPCCRPALPGRVIDRLFVGDRYECLVELAGGQSLIAYQDIGAPHHGEALITFDRLPEVYGA